MALLAYKREDEVNFNSNACFLLVHVLLLPSQPSPLQSALCVCLGVSLAYSYLFPPQLHLKKRVLYSKNAGGLGTRLDQEAACILTMSLRESYCSQTN